MRDYEIMLILPAEADDKVIGGVTDRISQVLGQHGGQLGTVDRWGRRRFAYPIDKQTEGFYAVGQFTAEPDGLKELDRVLSLADDVIRFKVVVRPPGAPAKAAPAPVEAAREVRAAPAPKVKAAPEEAVSETSAPPEPEAAPEEAEEPAEETAGAPSTGAT